MQGVDTSRADAIVDLVTGLADVRRARGPVEAAPALTRAYVALELACGLAARGDRERASEARERARAELGPAIADPTHAWMVSAYAARVDGVPPPARTLDHQSGYRAARLCEASFLLAPYYSVDVIEAFKAKRAPEPTAELEPAARGPALLVAARAGLALADPDARGRALELVLEHGRELPEAPALVDAALPALADLPPRARARLAARIVLVAARGSAPVSPAALASLAHLEILDAEAPALACAIDGLIALAAHDDLRRLAEAPAVGGELARIFLAGAWFALGEPARARSIAQPAIAHVRSREPREARLVTLRALGLAYRHAPLAITTTDLAAVLPVFAQITDAYGTNSHYCWSVIAFVDALVVAMVGT